MDQSDQSEKVQTVGDLLDQIYRDDKGGATEAREKLLTHIATLAERQWQLGYKQAQRDMLLVVADLTPDPNTRSDRTDVL